MSKNEILLHEYIVCLDQIENTIEKALNVKAYSAVFILVDENSKEHCLPILMPYLPNFEVIEIQSGEIHKNLTTCEIIWSKLIQANAGRNALLINLGGGVIGDMGGFCASVYKRGIDFIQIPTTLLSQVDASVGGKLGIDFKLIKNCIGAFCNPQTVLIDIRFLKTLPPKEFLSGYAEIFKHALIYDKKYWVQLTNTEPSLQMDFSFLQEVIHTSVQIKKEVVTADPFEKGLRKILNFGHTIGHAVETWFLENAEVPLLHGEAIVIGMICESFLSNKLNTLSNAQLNYIVDTFSLHYNHHLIPGEALEAILGHIKNDKKNIAKENNFTFLKTIGLAEYNCSAKKEDILASIQFYNHLKK